MEMKLAVQQLEEEGERRGAEEGEGQGKGRVEEAAEIETTGGRRRREGGGGSRHCALKPQPSAFSLTLHTCPHTLSAAAEAQQQRRQEQEQEDEGEEGAEAVPPPPPPPPPAPLSEAAKEQAAREALLALTLDHLEHYWQDDDRWKVGGSWGWQLGGRRGDRCNVSAGALQMHPFLRPCL